MNKLKPYVFKIGIYLGGFIAGIALQVVSYTISPIIEMLFGTSKYQMLIIEGIIGSLTVCLVGFIFCFKEGYRKRRLEPLKTTVAVTFTGIAYTVSTFFMDAGLFAPFFAENFLKAAVFGEDYFESTKIRLQLDLQPWVIPLTVLIMYILFFAPSMILGEWAGVRKRKKDVEKLTQK